MKKEDYLDYEIYDIRPQIWKEIKQGLCLGAIFGVLIASAIMLFTN